MTEDLAAWDANATSTPRQDGFRMPAEWGRHSATLMAWPKRADLWGDLFESAERDYAVVANAIADFEPLVMVTDPVAAGSARKQLSDAIEILPVPIDDSWMRDSGPIFVTDGIGNVALVHFGFNGWGEKYVPYDLDAAVPAAIARHLGMRRYIAPIVLEGGSFFVDGEGTLLTTEQCLLHPNRNPGWSRTRLEVVLGEFLGVDIVIWLGRGHPLDRDTDGHVDGIAQYVGPGRILLDAPGDPQDGNHAAGRDNRDRLRAARDAAGRPIDVIAFDAGTPSATAYLNHYLVNGGLIVPADGEPNDERALQQLHEVYPDRELVTVPGRVLLEGGGGPHCITQQVPEDASLS
jgi:agmatine deiminase